jgi:transposase
MKFVGELTEEEKATLRSGQSEGPGARFRHRSQALLLSNRGYRLDQLADIFEVDRDTVSGWIDAWEKQGIRGLYDAPRTGRPTIYTEAEQQQLREWIEEEPRQIKRAQSRLEATTGKASSKKTLKRILKKTVTAGNDAAVR